MGYEIIIKVNESSFVIIPIKDFKDFKRVLDNYKRMAGLRSVHDYEK